MSKQMAEISITMVGRQKIRVTIPESKTDTDEDDLYQDDEDLLLEALMFAYCGDSGKAMQLLLKTAAEIIDNADVEKIDHAVASSDPRCAMFNEFIDLADRYRIGY